MKAVEITVRGRVQGVGYRAWLAEKAQEEGLGGWVRNRVDGRAEALLVGSAKDVSKIIDAARRGPSAAHVTAVDMKAATDAAMSELGRTTAFAILPTL